MCSEHRRDHPGLPSLMDHMRDGTLIAVVLNAGGRVHRRPWRRRPGWVTWFPLAVRLDRPPAIITTYGCCSHWKHKAWILAVLRVGTVVKAAAVSASTLEHHNAVTKERALCVGFAVAVDKREPAAYIDEQDNSNGKATDAEYAKN